MQVIVNFTDDEWARIIAALSTDGTSVNEYMVSQFLIACMKETVQNYETNLAYDKAAEVERVRLSVDNSW